MTITEYKNLQNKYGTLNSYQSLDKYKQNLKVSDDAVISYNTLVALIDHDKKQIKVLGWWSVTTSKHINYVANEYNYELIK